MNLDVVEGYDLICKAYEETANDRLYDRWLLGGYDREFGFEEFKDMLVGHLTSITQTEEEILKDVKTIIDDFNSKVVI